MILDFSKCKTVEDVDRVFKKYSKQLNTIEGLSKSIAKAAKERKSKLINKENQ